VRAVNLLPKDDQSRSTRKQNVPALIATALIVLVTGLIGVTYLSAKGTAESKKTELESARDELALMPSVADINAKDAPRQTLKSEHDARVNALSTALTRRVAWDRILREISLVLPNDVWLRNMSATSPTPASGTSPAATPPGLPPTLMTIEGSTYSHDAVARLITRLSVIPDLKNVWLTKSELGVIAGRSIVSFTILADVRQSGATS
jgi:Tfp pilus assembly protein PilN